MNMGILVPSLESQKSCSTTSFEKSAGAGWTYQRLSTPVFTDIS